MHVPVCVCFWFGRGFTECNIWVREDISLWETVSREDSQNKMRSYFEFCIVEVVALMGWAIKFEIENCHGYDEPNLSGADV